MADFSDGERELLIITVSMETLQGAVNIRMTEMQWRWRMKKRRKKQSSTWSLDKNIQGSQRRWSLFHGLGAQLESQTLRNEHKAGLLYHTLTGWLSKFNTKVLLIVYPSWLRPWLRVCWPTGQCSMTGWAQEEGQKNRQNAKRRLLEGKMGHQSRQNLIVLPKSHCHANDKCRICLFFLSGLFVQFLRQNFETHLNSRTSELTGNILRTLAKGLIMFLI